MSLSHWVFESPWQQNDVIWFLNYFAYLGGGGVGRHINSNFVRASQAFNSAQTKPLPPCCRNGDAFEGWQMEWS